MPLEDTRTDPLTDPPPGWRQPSTLGPLGPWYAGEFQSAIARAKKVLLAAGFQWSVSGGRYQPYGSTKITSYGVRVTRVGCSDSITLHVYDSNSTSDQARDARRNLRASALDALRAAGLPFDDRGFLECGPRARKAIARVEGSR